MLAQSMAQRRACMTGWPPDSAHGLLFELLGVGFFAAIGEVARYKTGQIENSRQPCSQSKRRAIQYFAKISLRDQNKGRRTCVSYGLVSCWHRCLIWHGPTCRSRSKTSSLTKARSNSICHCLTPTPTGKASPPPPPSVFKSARPRSSPCPRRLASMWTTATSPWPHWVCAPAGAAADWTVLPQAANRALPMPGPGSTTNSRKTTTAPPCSALPKSPCAKSTAAAVPASNRPCWAPPLQEMKETEGAWWPIAMAGLAGGVVNGAYYAYNNPNRTWGGWTAVVGSGVVGGSIGGIRWWSSQIWGNGIIAAGAWAAPRIR